MKYPITLSLLATALAACSSDDTDASMPDAEVESAQVEQVGSVWAEYVPGQESASIHAQFVRVHGISADHALAALDVWRPETDLALDACSLRSRPSFASGDNVSVELLDAGPISIDADFGQVTIHSRRLPDVDRVSGVVYGNESGFDVAPVILPYEAGVTYHLTATGAEIGAIDVALVAPAIPQILNETDAARRLAVQDEVRLQWDPQSDPGADLFLAISAADGQVMNCHLEDDGEFVLPAALVEPFRHAGSGELTLRRVSIIDADVDGLEHTRIVFGARDSLFLFW